MLSRQSGTMLVQLERIFSLSLSGANHLIAAEDFFTPHVHNCLFSTLQLCWLEQCLLFFAVHHEKFFFFVRLTLITSLVHSQALLTFSMNFPRSVLENRTQRFLKTLPYFITIKSLVLVEQFSRACCYIKLNIKQQCICIICLLTRRLNLQQAILETTPGGFR